MRITKVVLAFIALVLTAAVMSAPAPAEAVTLSCPASSQNGGIPWVSYLTGKGVKVCVLKNFLDQPIAYMQQVDLSAGARIRNAYSFSSTAGSSSFPNQPFNKKTVNDWYNWAASNIASPSGAQFSAVNGQFFSDNLGAATSTMSFPFKDQGALKTVGADWAAKPKRVFGIYNSGSLALVRDYSNTNNSWSVVDNSLSDVNTATLGFHPTNYAISGNTNRTWAGVRDNTGDGNAETVYLLTGLNVTQAVMQSWFSDYGVSSSSYLQFDGGGSAQLRVRNVNVVNSSDPTPRWVTHAFIVYEAP